MTSVAPQPGEADPLSISGIVAPIVTAFDADEQVAPRATAAHASFVEARGCSAVFALGTNGECPLLDPAERIAVVEAVTDAIDTVPVLAGVGAPSTVQTIDRAEEATAAGADGLVVVTPYYYPVDDQGLVEHYRRVAAAVDVPIYLYRFPARTGNSLSLAAFREIASIDGVAGIKDSSGDLAWLGQAIDAAPDLTVLTGSDDVLLPGLALGTAGAVSAAANVFPELVVELYGAYDAGECERASALQSTLYRLRRAIDAGPFMSGVKTALALRDLDFDVGGLRGPLRTMDADQRATLEAELRELELL